MLHWGRRQRQQRQSLQRQRRGKEKGNERARARKTRGGDLGQRGGHVAGGGGRRDMKTALALALIALSKPHQFDIEGIAYNVSALKLLKL